MAAPVASPAPGWRVSATAGPTAGVTHPGNLVAVGPADAWSTWTGCSPCSGANSSTTFWAEHWGGRGWRVVRLPAALRGFASGPMTVAASRADVWLFNTAVRRALYDRGHGWTARSLPSWVIRMDLAGSVSLSVADFGPGNLWAFSLGQMSFTPTVPFAARFDGHHWRKVRLPGIPVEVSAVSARDIWLLAVPASLKVRRPSLFHWNGRSWRSLAVPAPTKVPAHSTEYTGDLVAGGPGDVWLKRDIQVGSQGARTLYLLHWNGRTWRRVGLGLPVSGVDVMALDGHGGLWLIDNGPKPAYRWYFDHLSGGRWSRQPIPATSTTTGQEVLMLANIPGTQSMWAAGALLPKGSTTEVVGGIWRYGR